MSSIDRTRLVTVFGASGFVGRHVVRALAKEGWRIRAAMRRPELAGHLQPLGQVGQIAAIQANLRHPGSVARAVEGADAVVNLVGILQPGGQQSFEAVQAKGAETVARAAQGRKLIHISAIGADPASGSLYAQSKAQGERAVLALHADSRVIRPSIVFGPEDSFFNRFAVLARALPVLPIAGADTRFQPVFVGDVAQAVARLLEAPSQAGRLYELGGPDIKTFRELVAYTCAVIRRKRIIVPLPFPAARLQAWTMEMLDTISLGLLPDELVLTRDQVLLLETDNIVSNEAVASGATLQGLGITPTSLEAIVPSYLARFRKHGQFDVEQGV